MKRNSVDYCLYIMDESYKHRIIALYVSELLISINDEGKMMHPKRELSLRFIMKDWGEWRFIMGIYINRNRPSRTLHIIETRYAMKNF